MSSQSKIKEINNSIKNEEKIEIEQNLALINSKIILEKVEKSICEIIKDKDYGSGFFFLN